MEIYFVPLNRPFFLFLCMPYDLLLKIWHVRTQPPPLVFADYYAIPSVIGRVYPQPWDPLGMKLTSQVFFPGHESCLCHMCAFPSLQFPWNTWLLLSVLSSWRILRLLLRALHDPGIHGSVIPLQFSCSVVLSTSFSDFCQSEIWAMLLFPVGTLESSATEISSSGIPQTSPSDLREGTGNWVTSSQPCHTWEKVEWGWVKRP